MAKANQVPWDGVPKSLPEYLTPFADWTFDDFYREALADHVEDSRAKRHATMYAWKVGDFALGAVPVDEAWFFHPRPWFGDGGLVAFVTSRGRRHQAVDRKGNVIGPEQRDLAAMLAWFSHNGWVTL